MNTLDAWPLRRVVVASVLATALGVVPLLGLAAYRFHQVRTDQPVWARLAQASRWLSLGAVCSGADSPGMARADMERWRDALAAIEATAARLAPSGVVPSTGVLAGELNHGLAGPETSWVPWVTTHCDQVDRLAGQVLEAAVRLGLDASTRADRPADLALRDLAVYGVAWVVLVGLVIATATRQVMVPARRLEQALLRIVDGDATAVIPEEVGGAVAGVAAALRRAMDGMKSKDKSKSARIAELRNVVRRLIEMVELPVVVIGVDRRLDYVNEQAADVLGQGADKLYDVDLTKVAWGEELRRVVDHVLEQGESSFDSVVHGRDDKRSQHIAHCAVVRDAGGAPSRVIVVLEREQRAFWRHLMRSVDQGL